MQRSCDPWFAECLLSGRPNVGALMSLCEENFSLLLRLAPDLRHDSGILTSRRSGGIDLHLEIQDQARYTTRARLTHYFVKPDGADPHPEPDACLRVYHDARQVELLDLRQSVLPLRNDYQHPALADKWQANLFLAKWLSFCLRQGHRFGPSSLSAAPSDRSRPAPSCT